MIYPCIAKKKVGLLFVILCVALIDIFSENVLVVKKYESFDIVVIIDKEFEHFAEIMDKEAKRNNMRIMVQESFRVDGRIVENSIVIPYKKSNHFIGHAIDINIIYNGIWYNSSKLRKYDELPEAIKNFINGCKRNGLSWGGNYSINDAVHFDDNLNNYDPVKYEMIYNKHQG